MIATKIKVKYIDPIYQSCEDDFYEDDAGLHIELRCQHNQTTTEVMVINVVPDHRGEPVEIDGLVTYCDNCDEQIVEGEEI